MDKLQQLIEWLEEKYINLRDSWPESSITWRILAKAREIEAEEEERNFMPTGNYNGEPTFTGYVKDLNGWIPTKGEMIEVSDDGVNWHTRRFKEKHWDFFWCGPIHYSSEIWKYAKPLTVEKVEKKPIELPPENKAFTIGWIPYDNTKQQLEVLTKSLREVIEVVNKLTK